MPRRVCTFAIAHTDIDGQPFNNAQRTVRVIVPNNLQGTGLYFKFSNYYSDEPVWVGNATVALADKKGNLLAGTQRPLTVYGDTSFAVVPQRDVFSDYIALPVQPGCNLAISLHYPSAHKVTSGNFVGLFAQRSVKGDYCAAQQDFPNAKLLSRLSTKLLPWDLTSAITTLTEIIVQQDDDAPVPRVLATFGDSIMQQGAWVTPFTQRLYEAYPGMISVCNLGIGGNRLLYGSPPLAKGIYGHAGMERFRSDLLPIEGLTHVLFALGTNDIGLPGKDGAPDSELITLEQYAAAVTALVAQVRHCKVQKVFAGKLLPREINHVYTEEREQLRHAMNHWLDTCGLFDAVLDLGAPIADASGIGMQKEYALADGLHPNLEGGRRIAQAVDLSLFA